jgi:hypothetical protein
LVQGARRRSPIGSSGVQRIRIGSASIVFSDRWIPNKRVLAIQRANIEGREPGESVHGTVVRSPRGTGAFEVEVVPNALDDAGVRDLAATDRAAALRRIHATALEAFAPLVSRPFDCSHGTRDGVAWYAFTIFWRTKAGLTTSELQRDWLLATATETEAGSPNRDLVLASYRSSAKPGADGLAGEAAVDIFDCEEMVRTTRFER